LGDARRMLDRQNRCPPQRLRRCRSAWRRQRETHSRTPYPAAKPTIRAITISIGQLENWSVTIRGQLTYMNLTDVVAVFFVLVGVVEEVASISVLCRDQPYHGPPSKQAGRSGARSRECAPADDPAQNKRKESGSQPLEVDGGRCQVGLDLHIGE